ncbi:YkgJ family cysteine cluster protein [Desulfobotulus mexicanus]|uniref:YkgJ family cysteine cluster protein n=1 Tax=Desulfobotulus mexicanus TaxID=2586642 RepID=A0A5Q4VF67_9BACT|nr:YkgJ family cysteine cluster protein [Desulfobotulus mexicanus]TYT76315.1 YkgJ family cysteine cluster protein [Desulfobotulus mexicanus]
MNENSSGSLQPIAPDQLLCFDCHAGQPCFNQCCRDISQFLYPYDILRLKKNLNIKTSDFLASYCTIHDGESSGLPVVSLKLDESNQHACPFLGENGCCVYEDRPAACRIFPLARGLVRDRATGSLQAHYARIPDPVCKGFESKKNNTLKEWIASQEMEIYDRMNDAMMPLISLKNRLMPGALQPEQRHIFILGCYNLDDFRKAVYESGELQGIFPHQRLTGAENSEEELLLLAMDWVRHRLFGTAL